MAQPWQAAHRMAAFTKIQQSIFSDMFYMWHFGIVGLWNENRAVTMPILGQLAGVRSPGQGG